MSFSREVSDLLLIPRGGDFLAGQFFAAASARSCPRIRQS